MLAQFCRRFISIVLLSHLIFCLHQPSLESSFKETDVQICMRANDSVCKFYCNSGQDVIDLSAIDGSSTQPSFTNIPDSKGAPVFYQWSPCKTFLKDCSNSVNVCRVFKTSAERFNLGDEGPRIIFDHEEQRYRMDYVGPEEFLFGEIKTNVYLEYDSSSEGRTSSMKNYGGYFTMTLFTKYAPHVKNNKNEDLGNLGTGAVILIVFFSMTALYFGIGVLYLRFQRGSRGKEMIPHYSFWCEIPSLAKDGCSYILRIVLGCCSSARAEVSTRRNYERI